MRGIGIVVAGVLVLAGCKSEPTEPEEHRLIGYHAKMPLSWLKRHLELRSNRTDELGLVLAGCGRPKRSNTGCEQGVHIVAYHPLATDPPPVTHPSVGCTGWEVIKAHGEPHVEVSFVYIYRDGPNIKSEHETLIVPVREFVKAPSYDRIRDMAKIVYPTTR